MIEPPELPARSVSLMIRGIVLIAVIVVGVQFSQSIFGPQIRWKGGGFGMYTEPHPSRRVTWLIVEDASGQEHRLRLWPATERHHQTVQAQPARLRELLIELEILANRRATSGDPALDARLVTDALSISWRTAQNGVLSLDEGNPLEGVEARIEIYEIRYDIADGMIRTVRQ